MITKLRGTINEVLEEEVRLQVGPVEHQVLVPEVVRRQLQLRAGQEVELRTIEFLEGNITRGGRLTPRLIGFLHQIDLDFFDLFCTVDGVGLKTALRAMVRETADIADLIAKQETKGLSALPGIGASTAERIIAKLRKKVQVFAIAGRQATVSDDGKTGVSANIISEVYQSLVALGHSDTDARQHIDKALESGATYATATDLLAAIYSR